jgi:putative aldouronate transport system substrate-binding protein
MAYALPSVDGTAANPQINLGTTSYFVVNKSCAHPEAIFKMQNLFVQKGWGGTIEDYNTYFDYTKDGTMYETFKYSFGQAWPATKNLDTHKAIVDALKNKDISKLNPEQKTNYDTAQKYRNGDVKGWGMYRVFDEGGSFRIIDQYVSGNMMKLNAFYGADTATMTTKSSALSKLELETFTKIIMGDPLDNFDKFVANAMNLGGTQIQQEVNDWYATTAK